MRGFSKIRPPEESNSIVYSLLKHELERPDYFSTKVVESPGSPCEVHFAARLAKTEIAAEKDDRTSTFRRTIASTLKQAGERKVNAKKRRRKGPLIGKVRAEIRDRDAH
ncbi:hypothetical protein KM043_014545 [Ampulex compressa]|nr:hypothetical protein KM043_014545 [Ampulex compressa]